MTETKDAELFEKLESHAIRVKSIREHCNNEEQTKISLINPYLELIGFEVRDPRHVRLEYRADISTGTERVDYALLRDGRAHVLVEAKSADQRLPETASKQLIRYAMSVDSVQYAAITNGVIWDWYAKVPGSANLQELPFLSHDTSNPSQRELTWLYSLRENSADLAGIAMQESFRGRILNWISRQRSAPDAELIKVLAKAIGERRTTRVTRVLEEMWPNTFSNYIRSEVERALRRARVSDDQEPGAGVSDTLGTRSQESQPQSGSAESDSEAKSKECTDWREFQTITGTFLLRASEHRRAWRPNNEEHWRISRNVPEMCIEILKYLSAHHDAGPQAFYESLANSPISLVRNAFLRTSDIAAADPQQFIEVVPGWHLDRSQGTGAKLKRLKSMASHCVKNGQKVSLDSQFELWLPISSRSSSKVADG